MGRFVETIAEELEIRIEPLGSTTFQRPLLSGAEPNKCFYIQNIDAVKGKKRLDITKYPPPDLVVEIDITSSSEKRLEIYADIKVPEVWCYDGNNLRIYILENQKYLQSNRSLVFPQVPILEINIFLQQVESRDYLDVVRAFRSLVKSLLSP